MASVFLSVCRQNSLPGQSESPRRPRRHECKITLEPSADRRHDRYSGLALTAMDLINKFVLRLSTVPYLEGALRIYCNDVGRQSNETLVSLFPLYLPLKRGSKVLRRRYTTSQYWLLFSRPHGGDNGMRSPWIRGG